MTTTKQLLSSVAVVALSAAAAPIAHAQDAGGQEIITMEEMVVTAQRRAQSIQDVPIAVSAFSAQELEARQVTETLDLFRYVPNAIAHNNTGLGSANTYYIRGLGNTESVSTFDPPVGTYVDDIYMTRQNANNFSFFDVERVEVLRGPQGTLFGRNTTGGAVNVIMRKPGEEFGGFTEVGYGRFDKITARASVDVPVTDKLLTKVSGFYITDDGFVDNLTTGETINDEESWGIRGALRALPWDNVIWDFAVDYIDSDHASVFNFPNPNGGGRIAFTGMREDTANLAGLVAGEKADLGLGSVTRSLSVYSNLRVDFDDATLEVITGWREIDQRFSLDFFDGQFPSLDIPNRPDNTITNGSFGFATGGFAINNIGDHQQFTQEIKLNGTVLDGKFDYVVGFFYLNEDNSTDFADVFTVPGAPGTSVPLILADRILENDTEAAAGYVQVDYHATEQLTLTVGVRYTDETKNIRFTPNANPFIGTPAFLGVPFDTGDIAALGIPTEQQEEIFTPRFAAEYQVNDDLMLFASATRGFKSGGWNARGTSPGLIQPFAPEKVWSYETGWRSEWLQRRLRFNVTGFYSDTSDFQIPSAFDSGVGIEFITQNFADLEVFGIEVDMAAVPMEGLTVFANLGWQEAEYKNIDPSVMQTAENCLNDLATIPNFNPLNSDSCAVGIVAPDGSISDPVRTPAITLSFGATYEYPVEALRGSIIANANAQFVSDHTTSTSARPEGLADDRFLVNASIGYQFEDAIWAITAECQNCFGETYVVSNLPPFPYFDDPSTWLVKLRYNFGAY